MLENSGLNHILYGSNLTNKKYFLGLIFDVCSVVLLLNTVAVAVGNGLSSRLRERSDVVLLARQLLDVRIEKFRDLHKLGK